MSVVVLLGLMFISGVQPLMMVLSLIFISIFYSFLIFSMGGGYWFSYALLLVVLSGVLVIFTYMASLIPNESFEMGGLILFSVIIVLIFGFVDMFYGENFSFLSMQLWLSYISFLNLFLVVFLLSMMVVVVWLSCGEGDSMRIFLGAWVKSVNLMD